MFPHQKRQLVCQSPGCSRRAAPMIFHVLSSEVLAIEQVGWLAEVRRKPVANGARSGKQTGSRGIPEPTGAPGAVTFCSPPVSATLSVDSGAQKPPEPEPPAAARGGGFL